LGASKRVFRKDIEEMIEDDLQSLRASGVAETKILDFKKQLPFGYDNETKKTEWHVKTKMEFAKAGEHPPHASSQFGKEG